MLAVLRRPLARAIRSYSQDVNLKQIFEEHGVVADVIGCVPQSLLKVQFRSGAKPICGDVLTPTEVKDKPFLDWEAEKKSFYFVCLIDPDAPSREKPEFREWQHWLVGNVPGASINDGVTLQDFIPSAPPKGTGLHRYVFLVFKQPGKLSFTGVPRLTNTSAEGRGNFSIREFVEKYKLGPPVAGNFYFAEYDDHVPNVYKGLGISL